MLNKKRGNYLKELRLRKGLKQTDLADLLHYSFKNISKWENGKSFPTDPSILNKLAEILDVPVENLIYGEDNALENISKNSDKKFRYVGFSLFLIFLLILFFIIYSKYHNYYVAEVSNDYILNSKIYIILEEDYNRFKFNKLRTSKEIELVSFYYERNGSNYLLIESENEELIITEYSYHLEYDFESIVNDKCYLKVLYKDDSFDIFKLKFKKLFN